MSRKRHLYIRQSNADKVSVAKRDRTYRTPAGRRPPVRWNASDYPRGRFPAKRYFVGKVSLVQFCEDMGLDYPALKARIESWPLGTYSDWFWAQVAAVRELHSPSATLAERRRILHRANFFSKKARGFFHDDSD